MAPAVEVSDADLTGMAADQPLAAPRHGVILGRWTPATPRPGEPAHRVPFDELTDAVLPYGEFEIYQRLGGRRPRVAARTTRAGRTARPAAAGSCRRRRPLKEGNKEMVRHLVVVLLATIALTPAACSSAGSGPESDDVGTSAKPETKSPVVQREINVKMRRKSTGGTGTERLAYGLAVKLGTPLTSTPACDVAGPEGTVVVPVTITVTNPHRADGGKDTGVPGERWARPRHLTVEPVGVPGGELQFAPSSATQECGQDTRIADRSRDEDFDEGRTFVIAGFLSGVPRTGAAGAGVRVDFFDDEDWVAVSGDTQPFTVTF